VGRARCKDAGPIMGSSQRSYRGQASLQLVDLPGGEVLAGANVETALGHVAAAPASQKLIERLAEQVAVRLLAELPPP
jgi:hypothetical protein